MSNIAIVTRGAHAFKLYFVYTFNSFLKVRKPYTVTVYRLMSIYVNGTHSRTYVHKDPIHASLVISLSFLHNNTKTFVIFLFHKNIKLNAVRKPTEDVVLKLLQFE